MSQILCVSRLGCLQMTRMNGNILSKSTVQQRLKTYYKSGAIKPMPPVMPFAGLAFLGTVIPGLLIGAMISKNIANFLEENELFVPSDDDDDED